MSGCVLAWCELIRFTAPAVIRGSTSGCTLVRRDPAFATILALDRRPAFAPRGSDVTSGLFHDLISWNPKIRRNVRGRSHAEEGIEAMIHRTSGKRLVMALLFEAEMPLADYRGLITPSFQQRGDGDFALSNQWMRGPLGHIRAKRKSPGDQTVARRMTQRPRRVRIGELHLFPRQPINVRHRDLRLRIEALRRIARTNNVFGGLHRSQRCQHQDGAE